MIENSIYPDGIPSERWRMLSFPGRQDNPSIAKPKQEGHVFYVWDLDDSTWVVPDSIYTGQAYWFKHIYENPVPFSSDSGTAISLEPYTIKLKTGWNMVGSPFAFPVEVSADPNEVSALYFFGDSTNRDGWTLTEYKMNPWAGYAIYTDLDSSSIDLLPFPEDSDVNTARKIYENGWAISLSAESEKYFDQTGVIGRTINAEEAQDKMDIPRLPSISKGLLMAISLENENDFKYSSDVRSVDTKNGVWSVGLFSSGNPGSVRFSAKNRGLELGDIVISVLDIQTRKIYQDIFVNPIDINGRMNLGYEFKFVIGDQGYVESMLLEILSQIPSDFVLGKNYPNPFNPMTRIQFGLSEKDKFVCLAVRDPAYLKTYHSYQDWDYHNYRDSNIDNYILAAEELASRGYYVFRMGKVVSSPIKSNNSKIIDYASSNLRNDFMDIYLGAKCTFCISASSGFDGVTTTFRRPLVQIVVPLLDAKTEHKEVLILTKHHFSKKKKRNLTFSEIVLSEIANCTATKQFEELGVELIENSPKEIRDIVIEAVERMEGKWKNTEIDDSLQNKFWKIFYSSNYINSKRFAHGKFKARFGANFLKANPDWLN